MDQCVCSVAQPMGDAGRRGSRLGRHCLRDLLGPPLERGHRVCLSHAGLRRVLGGHHREPAASPVNAIVVDPDDPARLFIGSDVGCFYSEDFGGTWQMLGSGLPPVPVYDIKLHAPTRTLFAGTHGRSILAFDLTNLPDLAGAEGSSTGSATGLSNHPNPFSSKTEIAFSLARPAAVSLAVYDLAGRRVRLLVEGERGAGPHEISWDGRNDRGTAVASGVYFARLEAGGAVLTARLNLVK